MEQAQDIAGMNEDYAALDLRLGASLEEAKASYRRLARALHPDLNPEVAGLCSHGPHQPRLREPLPPPGRRAGAALVWRRRMPQKQGV